MFINQFQIFKESSMVLRNNIEILLKLNEDSSRFPDFYPESSEILIFKASIFSLHNFLLIFFRFFAFAIDQILPQTLQVQVKLLELLIGEISWIFIKIRCGHAQICQNNKISRLLLIVSKISHFFAMSASFFISRNILVRSFFARRNFMIHF